MASNGEIVCNNRCYPNPSNSSFNIELYFKEPGKLNISIFDITGRKIKELYSNTHPAGLCSFRWDGHDDNGIELPSGLYLYRIIWPEETKTGRMGLLK
jgi:flagellar hook assembly protein FlgD